MKLHLDLDDASIGDVIADIAAGVLIDRAIFSHQQVAKIAGMQDHLLHAARKRGDIDGERIGRSYHYSLAAILRYMARERQQQRRRRPGPKPKSEPEQSEAS